MKKMKFKVEKTLNFSVNDKYFKNSVYFNK